MGRLQKKKTAIQKSKTKQKTEKVAVEGGGVSKGAEGGVASVSKIASEAKPLVKISRDSVFGKWLQFLREVKTELQKVTWPTKEQTIRSTIGVIVLAIVVSLFLGVVDMGLSGLVQLVLG